MKHDYSLTDGDITLLPLSAGDSELYRRLRNQEQNRRCFFSSGIISREAQQQWYERYLMKENDYMFSVYNKNGQFTGGAALYDVDQQSAEFGRLLIDRTAAGKGGAGYQTLLLLCRFAKERFGLSLLRLELLADNIPAKRTYEKAGFVLQKQYPSSDGARLLYYMEKKL